jgi:hypothetical protein
MNAAAYDAQQARSCSPEAETMLHLRTRRVELLLNRAVADDPAGHRWTFSEAIANVDPAQRGGELTSARPI